MRQFRTAIAVAAVICTFVTGHGARAQPASAYHAKLQACLAAAANVTDEPDPTDFRCDWKTVLAGAPGAALTGKFDARQRGVTGTMAILEPADGTPAQIAISTVTAKTAATCTAQLAATRSDGDALVAKSADDPKCTIRIVSSAPNLVRVTADRCQFYCGLGGTFEGEWKLRLK